MPGHLATGDKASRLANIAQLAAQAAQADIRLLVFPELCLAARSEAHNLRRKECERLAEAFDGATPDAVAAIAKRTGVALGVGLIERAGDGRLFNSYVVCMPDGARHRQRKLHVCGQAPFHEGDGFTVFDTPWGGRAAILIGADNELVENVRAAALLGAALLIAPYRAGLAAEEGRVRRSLAARAEENGMFVVCCRGLDDDQGAPARESMVFDPDGESLPPIKDPLAAIRTFDLDLAAVAQSAGRRALKARRPELYGLLAETRVSEPARPQAGIAAKGSVALPFAIVTRRPVLI